MRGYNRVILAGNLTRDPQLKYLPNQTAVVEFGLAMNRKWRGADGQEREETTFVDCASFGKQAEVINQYFTKGKPILIEGRLKFDTWEDKAGGGKRSKLSVVIDTFEFIGGPAGTSGAGGPGGSSGSEYGEAPSGAPASRPPQQARAPYRPQAPAQQGPPADYGQQNQAPPSRSAEPPFSEEQQFKDDDIPF